MRIVADRTLRACAVAWFIPALIGQWIFAYHIASEYIATALAGNAAVWNKRLFVGFVDGDHVGNAALAVHLFIAFVITIGGTLQLIPQIPNRAPRHSTAGMGVPILRSRSSRAWPRFI